MTLRIGDGAATSLSARPARPLSAAVMPPAPAALAVTHRIMMLTA